MTETGTRTGAEADMEMETMERDPFHIKSSLGWNKTLFDVVDPKTGTVLKEKVPVGGIFSQIPRSDLVFAVLGKAADRWTRENFLTVVRQMRKWGFIPFIWKDDGMKSSDGELRLFPFVRVGFNFIEFMKKEFDADFSEVIPQNPGKWVKVAKYFTQGVDFSRGAIARVLVVPKEVLPIDGCGYSVDQLIPNTGDVVKVVGIGRNSGADSSAVYKGIILQNTPVRKVIPRTTMADLKRRGLRFGEDFDVLTSDETMKFSTPWTIYRTSLFYHDDSSRNVHRTVTVSEQLVRNLELTPEFRGVLEKEIEKRWKETRKAFHLKGKALGRWLKHLAEGQDFDVDDPSQNLILADVANLLLVGIPFGFSGVRRNIVKGIQGLIRRRGVSDMKIPGVFCFVVANETLAEDEVVVPLSMKRMGVEIGSEVTLWRSPISPTSVRTYRVRGFVKDNHVEMKSRPLAIYHDGDTDGDKVAVVPGRIVVRNRPSETARTKELRKLIQETRKRVSKPLPEGNTFAEKLANEIEVVVISKEVGLAERIRAGVELTTLDWELAHAWFREIEQGLIEMKKHSSEEGVWSVTDVARELRKKVNIGFRPAFHRLLANRRQSFPDDEEDVIETMNRNSNERVIDGIKGLIRRAEGELEKMPDTVPFKRAYRGGLEIAKLIVSGVEITDKDKKDLSDLKQRMKRKILSIMGTLSPKEKEVVLKNVVNPNTFRMIGKLAEMNRDMGQFLHTLGRSRNGTGQLRNGTRMTKQEFVEYEKRLFDSAKGGVREIIIATAIINERYWWISNGYFSPAEIQALIDTDTETPTDTDPESPTPTDPSPTPTSTDPDTESPDPTSPINVIVAGSRTFNNYELLKDTLDNLFKGAKREIVIVSGMAKGADSLAIRYARERGLKVIKMPADWDKYGRSAGYIRNNEMAKIAEALVAFWDGKSPGTRHMIETMRRLGKYVEVVRF